MNTNGAVYGNMLASDDDINITISRSTHADFEQETNSELIIILAGYKNGSMVIGLTRNFLPRVMTTISNCLL